MNAFTVKGFVLTPGKTLVDLAGKGITNKHGNQIDTEWATGLQEDIVENGHEVFYTFMGVKGGQHLQVGQQSEFEGQDKHKLELEEVTPEELFKKYTEYMIETGDINTFADAVEFVGKAAAEGIFRTVDVFGTAGKAVSAIEQAGLTFPDGEVISEAALREAGFDADDDIQFIVAAMNGKAHISNVQRDMASHPLASILGFPQPLGEVRL